MTFKQILIKYNSIISKNQLNEILALTERNFGVFSRDMELDIRSLIKNPEVVEYFDRIIHEERPKLEYDKDENKESKAKAEEVEIKESFTFKPQRNVPKKKCGKNMMPWDDEEINCTVVGIDFNYPSSVTICVTYRYNGKLKRERIDVETYSVSNLAKKKYISLPKARILMLAYTLLTMKREGVTFDFIHYAVRGRGVTDINELWSRAYGIYEQLHEPADIIKKFGQYELKPSKRKSYINRIYKINIPNVDFFKWGLPINSNVGWAIAVYLTNPTYLRENRRMDYLVYVKNELVKNKKPKSKSNNQSEKDTFSFVKSNWSKSWGNYNLIDD